jgi:peptide/nickel transport system substrate-binding protein
VTRLPIRVAELVPGMTDAAKLFVEQAAEAGLTVTIQPASADTFWADFTTLMSTPFQSISWLNRPAATHVAAFTGSKAGFNVTGVGGGAYDRMLASMQSTVDPGRRQDALNELQDYLWARGGDLVWGFAEQLDATVPGVRGIGYAQSLPRLEQISMP